MNKYFFEIEDIPFEDELERLGLTKKSFLNLPAYYIDNILIGRLSPVFCLDFRETIGEKKFTKISLVKNDNKSTRVEYHFVQKEFNNILNLSNRKIEDLMSGKIVKHIIRNKNYVLEIDHDTKTIMSVPYESIELPSLFNSSIEELLEKVTITKGKERLYTLGLSLIERGSFLVQEGKYEEWIKRKSINKYLFDNEIHYLKYNSETKEWSINKALI